MADPLSAGVLVAAGTAVLIGIGAAATVVGTGGQIVNTVHNIRKDHKKQQYGQAEQQVFAVVLLRNES